MNIKNIFLFLFFSLLAGNAFAAATVMGYCELKNGKTLSVWAGDNGSYNYTLYGKSGTTELQLKEGLFGVRAFHYYHSIRDGVGAFKYLRFNKGEYDYVVMSYEDGRSPYFDGVIVFRNGNRIARLECAHPFTGAFSVEELDAGHNQDSEDMAEYIMSTFT